MASVLTCELCVSEPRLTLPLCYAGLMVLHTMIDHEWPAERVVRVRRMVSRSGHVIWGLGALGRKRSLLVVWRVRQAKPGKADPMLVPCAAGEPFLPP